MKGVAAAPVSFGVFELTSDGPTAAPETILTAVHEAGYDGIDLGPLGWLGYGEQLRERLRRHQLALAGGWVDLPFSDDAAFAASLPTLDAALAAFLAAAEQQPHRPPLPTLADSGSAVRRAHPGGAPAHPTHAPQLALTDAGWDRLTSNVMIAAEQVRRAGLEPTFHHHVSTYVETPAEIDRLLAATDLGLTLDTGHLLLGGGDPIAALSHWAGRINHVHLKDAHRAVQAEAIRAGGDMREVWRRGVFPPLGAGDLALAEFMNALVSSPYDGWLVVEQDLIPAPSGPLDQVAADQRANRQTLRRWLP